MGETALTTQLSLRLPTDLLDDFNRIAAVLQRDCSWVMLRALQAYIDNEGADVLAEAEGIASLDRDEGVTLDSVQSEAEAIVGEVRGRRRRTG